MISLRRAFFVITSAAFCLASFSVAQAVEWKVEKIGNRDYLSVENVAAFYNFFTVADPLAKKIRLANGSGDLEVLLNSREVMVNGVRNWLSFPIIEKDGKYLISRVDLAKTLEPQLRPHMIPNLEDVKTVVLDAGHGGYDKGATSPYGCEKDFTLDVARSLKPLLEAKGFKVIMTRTSDVFVPLELRARIANAARNAIFVSIHFNATNSNPTASGFEIYSLTPVGSPSTQDDGLALSFVNRQNGSPVDAPSLELSAAVYHSVLGALPEFDRGIKRARFAVLRLTKIPAILMEGGFLTEQGESRLIANKEWRAKLAQAMCTGIDSYRNLVENKTRPLTVADYRRQKSSEMIARDATKPAADKPPVVPVSN